MGMTIINIENSFIKFGLPDYFEHCNFGRVDFKLPVYADDDISFQFVVQTDTESEADQLCDPAGGEMILELVESCDDVQELLTPAVNYQRYRIGLTQVLYLLPNPLNGFPGPIVAGQCFRFRVTLTTSYGAYLACSNQMQRITDPCFTSVVDYSNEDDAFGFKYCLGGEVAGSDESSCEPTIVQFFNQSTLTIPYTAQLAAKYGVVPTIQVWIYNESGQLQSMGIQALFDAVPPTLLSFDFGGSASGIVVIR